MRMCSCGNRKVNAVRGSARQTENVFFADSKTQERRGKQEGEETERIKAEEELLEKFGKARRVGRSPPKGIQKGRKMEEEEVKGQLKDVRKKLEQITGALERVFSEIQEGRKDNNELRKEVTDMRGELTDIWGEWRLRESKMIEESKKVEELEKEMR